MPLIIVTLFRNLAVNPVLAMPYNVFQGVSPMTQLLVQLNFHANELMSSLVSKCFVSCLLPSKAFIIAAVAPLAVQHSAMVMTIVAWNFSNDGNQ